MIYIVRGKIIKAADVAERSKLNNAMLPSSAGRFDIKNSLPQNAVGVINKKTMFQDIITKGAVQNYNGI